MLLCMSSFSEKDGNFITSLLDSAVKLNKLVIGNILPT